MKSKPPNALERDVLRVLLRELRTALRKKKQATIIVDPWLQGGGTYVFVSFNESGRTYEIDPPAPSKKAERSKR